MVVKIQRERADVLCVLPWPRVDETSVYPVSYRLYTKRAKRRFQASGGRVESRSAQLSCAGAANHYDESQCVATRNLLSAGQ